MFYSRVYCKGVSMQSVSDKSENRQVDTYLLYCGENFFKLTTLSRHEYSSYVTLQNVPYSDLANRQHLVPSLATG